MIKPTCPVCGTDARRLYPVGRAAGGKNVRQAHPRWFICEKGHRLYRKKLRWV